jgi:hypothetical protein
MTNYAVTKDDVAAHGKTLSANTEDVVTFAKLPRFVEVVIHAATAPVFVTIDGTAAIVNGSRCIVLAAVAGNTKRFTMPPNQQRVRLISSAAATYSVQQVA